MPFGSLGRRVLHGNGLGKYLRMLRCYKRRLIERSRDMWLSPSTFQEKHRRRDCQALWQIWLSSTEQASFNHLSVLWRRGSIGKCRLYLDSSQILIVFLVQCVMGQPHSLFQGPNSGL